MKNILAQIIELKHKKDRQTIVNPENIFWHLNVNTVRVKNKDGPNMFR